MSQLPRIVIIGRPNVGKSTLFNRICGRRRALVGNEPGMTRDRLYAPAEWLGKPFEIIDTGGIIPEEKDLIPSEIFRQAKKAIEEATHLILVVDAQSGVVPLDQELAHLMHRTGKKIALAVNKIDAQKHAPLAAEFHRLGIQHAFPISAEHGLGIDDLLDHVTEGFTHAPREDDDRPVRRRGSRSSAPEAERLEAGEAAPAVSGQSAAGSHQRGHHWPAQRGQVDAAELPAG